MSWTNAAMGLVVTVTLTTSLAYSAEPRTPTEVVHEAPTDSATSVEAALVCGALAAYGWVAVKFFDLGREFGRALAGQPRPVDRPKKDKDGDPPSRNLPDYLLD